MKNESTTKGGNRKAGSKSETNSVKQVGGEVMNIRSYTVEVACDLSENVERALRIWDSWDGYRIERAARRRMEANYAHAVNKLKDFLLGQGITGPELAMVIHRGHKPSVQAALPTMVL